MISISLILDHPSTLLKCTETKALIHLSICNISCQNSPVSLCETKLNIHVWKLYKL